MIAPVAQYRKAILGDGTPVIVDANNRTRNGRGKWLYFATPELDCEEAGKARGHYYSKYALYAPDFSGDLVIG